MSRTPIKLFVSDIDGTLVRDDKSLAPVTIQAFARLRAAGVQTSLISARPPSGLLDLARALEISGPIGAFNGGTILRADGQIMTAERLSPTVARTTLDMLDTAGVPIWTFAQGRWFARTDQGPRIAHERVAAHLAPTLVSEFSVEDVDKIVGVSEDFTALERLEPLVAGALQNATVARSQPYFLDITAPGANKGDGVAALAKAAGVSLSAVAVIGDMANDLPMFARAGLAIAMGQAPNAVRMAATEVTTSNEEDGVAFAVDRFILGSASFAR